MAKRTTAYLNRANPVVFTVFATLAIFCTYTCMYAFRKAFSVAKFEDQEVFGISYKIAIITSQVIGYTLSKFIGIKIVSELKQAKRAQTILLLIGLSGVALFLFAITPTPINIFFMFLSGLPIGMIYGIVYGYLEGRRITDILVMGLNLTMIVSSGFIKTIGKIILDSGVTEYWMPFVTAILFVPLLLLSVWMLEQFPAPTAEDKAYKTERKPMNRHERRAFMKTFTAGMVVFLLAYVLLTSLRDFRDNFSAEIWQELGYGDSSNIFTRTEIPIGLGILLLVAGLKWVKDNVKAFMAIHFVAIAGAVIIGISTLCFEKMWISSYTWTVCVGLGLYVSYIPANSLFFERLIASFHYISTASFMATLADFYGYLGSVTVLFYKNFGSGEISYLHFFKVASYVVSILLVILFSISAAYFKHKLKKGIVGHHATLPAESMNNELVNK